MNEPDEAELLAAVQDSYCRMLREQIAACAAKGRTGSCVIGAPQAGIAVLVIFHPSAFLAAAALNQIGRDMLGETVHEQEVRATRIERDQDSNPTNRLN